MASHTLTELQTLEPVTIDARSYAVAPSRMSHERPAEASPVASMANTTPTTSLSRTRAIVVITQLMGLTLFAEEGLLLWPTSVFYLTAGSCLLTAGTIADLVGTKRVNLVGAFLSATFALAFGLARTGGELIVFRALQGVANAIFVPSSISIISMNMEEGRPRNLGFACLGFASTIGFSLGLVLGGILVDRTGWRPAFYLAGAISFVLAFIGIWALPGDKRLPSNPSVWKQLASQIDWIGAVLASTGLAMLSYVLSTYPELALEQLCIYQHMYHGSLHHCHHELHGTIQQLVFPRSPRALSAGGLPQNSPFLNCWRRNQSDDWHLRQSCAGDVGNVDLLGHERRSATFDGAHLAPVAVLILAPLSCDMLFTVGLLVVSGVFPKHMQALSGAVFNTCAQLGTAIGLTLTSVISTSVTNASHETNKASPSALMEGYRAVFWTMLAWMLAGCLTCLFGLRRVEGVGRKRD
ncbi:major facilitator superfamily transporter [Seiridium cupressi]